MIVVLTVKSSTWKTCFSQTCRQRSTTTFKRPFTTSFLNWWKACNEMKCIPLVLDFSAFHKQISALVTSVSSFSKRMSWTRDFHFLLLIMSPDEIMSFWAFFHILNIDINSFYSNSSNPWLLKRTPDCWNRFMNKVVVKFHTFLPLSGGEFFSRICTVETRSIQALGLYYYWLFLDRDISLAASPRLFNPRSLKKEERSENCYVARKHFATPSTVFK